MPETPESVLHDRESKRLERLSEIASEPNLKATLARLARLHARIASELRSSQSSEVEIPRLMRPERTPARYKMRLLEPGGCALALPIEADSDSEALQIAWFVQEACSDFSDGFDLWVESRPIANSYDRRSVRRRETLRVTQSMQGAILRVLDALRGKRPDLARSRRLLETVDRLQSPAAQSD
jgi:hypothetical protein